jgi:hypothetical protein
MVAVNAPTTNRLTQALLAPQQPAAPARLASADDAASAQTSQGIGTPTKTLPPPTTEANQTLKPSPAEAAKAAKDTVHAVLEARQGLHDLLGATPLNQGDIDAKLGELVILEQSAITAATDSCRLQMSSVESACAKLKSAENDMEIAGKSYVAHGGSKSSREIVGAYLQACDNLADASKDFRRACLNAEDAVTLQKQFEGTPKGDATAARHNFKIADYQVSAAKMALKGAKNQPDPEQAKTAAQKEVDIALARRWDSAREELKASQAWAVDAKQGDISKSKAWVNEAKDDLQKSQPAP